MRKVVSFVSNQDVKEDCPTLNVTYDRVSPLQSFDFQLGSLDPELGLVAGVYKILLPNVSDGCSAVNGN